MLWLNRGNIRWFFPNWKRFVQFFVLSQFNKEEGYVADLDEQTKSREDIEHSFSQASLLDNCSLLTSNNAIDKYSIMFPY